MMYTTIDKILGWSVAIFVVAVLAAVIVYVPVNLAAGAKCLQGGYPKYAVTWNLKRYCMTLDGAVTVKVDEL